MIKLAVVADDLTGANDTAVQFAKQGIESCVHLDLPCHDFKAEKAEVVVLDTDSRDVSPQEAYQRVQQACCWLKRAGVTSIYKKVDSTLRGNLGVEIEAAAACLQSELVIIAPAFPASRRITVGGYHLLDGMPIEFTEVAAAPKSAVQESNIVQVLSTQTTCPIGLVSLSVVKAGVEAIITAIAKCLDSRQTWIVFDAVADIHLQDILTASRRYKNPLLVGSAGMAQYVAKWHQSEPYKAHVLPDANGAVAIMAGSVSRITQQQIQAALCLPGMRLIKLDVAQLINDKWREVARCSREARNFIERGDDILISSTVDGYDMPSTSVIKSAQVAMSAQAISCYIAAAFGEIAAALHGDSLAGMVLTGGDTAVHVCRAINADAVKIVQEVATGIPLGRLVGGSFDGVRVVTKAGAFGDQDALIQAVKAIKQSFV